MSDPKPTIKLPEASPTTCVVGCKLPHGLKLELRNESGVVQAHTLKGANDTRIVGGYGLTDGIPTSFMTTWLERNAKHPAVVNGAIFMHDSVRGAESCAREFRELRTGIEAIDPIADARAKGLEIDKDAAAKYRKQQAENPHRNRQRVE